MNAPKEAVMMKQCKLGQSGPLVGRMGYGAAGLEGYYGASNEKQGISAINTALDIGVTMIDTADFYGKGNNEALVGKAIKGRRDDAFIATKFGIVTDKNESGNTFVTGWDGVSFRINGSADYAKKALDRSLKRLDIDAVDLWNIHYPDPGIPIEETVTAMAEEVKLGRVHYLGLSNVSVEQVRRAHKIHPIAAVQYEYSLWRREAEIELLPTLRELGIALVAWSPLGGGFLTGTIDSNNNDIPFRQANPKLAGANLAINQKRFAPFIALAQEMAVTPAQLSLAWMLHKGFDIFPIPGTRSGERVKENAQAVDLVLSDEVAKRIDDMATIGLAEGGTIL